MGNRWDIRFVTDWDEIYSPEFQRNWYFWVENAVNSHVFFHPVLANSWLNSFRKIWKMEPLFIIAKSESTTIFFPLIQFVQNYRSFFRKTISPVGYSSFDYADPLVVGNYEGFPDNFFDVVINEIKQFRYDLLLFPGLHNEICNDLIDLNSREKCYFTRLIGLDGRISTLLYQMSSKNRREHLRVERRLKELGNITFDLSNEINSSVEYEIRQFIKSYRARWPKAFFAAGFHESLIKDGISHNLAWFTQLKLNDTSIGWAVDFVWKNRCYAYMHTYNRDYISYAPGRTHLMERLNKAMSSGIEVFDLLTGSEPYKSEWFNQYVELYSHQINSSKPVSIIKNKLNLIKNSILK